MAFIFIFSRKKAIRILKIYSREIFLQASVMFQRISRTVESLQKERSVGDPSAEFLEYCAKYEELFHPQGVEVQAFLFRNFIEHNSCVT